MCGAFSSGGSEGLNFDPHFMRPLAPCFDGSAASLHLYLLTSRELQFRNAPPRNYLASNFPSRSNMDR